MEGAGVRLERVFGYHEVPAFNPFLLLDHFGSENPEDYLAGFPWHPHRGIETVTYMIRGSVEHKDSIGNSGLIRSGDVQWMSAGSGIIHQEMPRRYEGEMVGFQLWVNLPASHKMMPPRYRGIDADDIPVVVTGNDVRVKVVAGAFDGVSGPVQDLVVTCRYFDVALPAGITFEHNLPHDQTSFAYVFEGQGSFGHHPPQIVSEKHLALFENGETVQVAADRGPVRFLLISGKAIGEPVAWRGPIVMNTEQELDLAFQEYRSGDFIKHP